jgi:hypothetical protein
MLKFRRICSLTLLGISLVGPALAQTGPAQPIPARPAAPPATNAGPARPGPATLGPGRLRKSPEGWRATGIVGSAVYNGLDPRSERVGSIVDLLVDDSGKVKDAVVSVGGFLGIGRKLVAIPYERLQFAELRTARPSASAGSITTMPSNQAGDIRDQGPPPTPIAPPPTGAPTVASTVSGPVIVIVLPEATRDSVRALPEFKFTP